MEILGEKDWTYQWNFPRRHGLQVLSKHGDRKQVSQSHAFRDGIWSASAHLTRDEQFGLSSGNATNNETVCVRKGHSFWALEGGGDEEGFFMIYLYYVCPAEWDWTK